MNSSLTLHIEAIIFAATEPLREKDIRLILEKSLETEIPEEELRASIEFLRSRYDQEDYAIELVHINEGYQFMTKGAYHGSLGVLLRESTKKRLSRVALETLAIIAYKQPVTKSELEAIRGVNCDYAVEKLLDKELVQIKGRSDGPGRPLLYGTTAKFMDYFGLGSLSDLPKPKEFQTPMNQIGELPDITEYIPDESDAAVQEEE